MDEAQFGRYRLLELLGRGGMGEVWRAFDNETQRVVAVKVLPAHLANDPQFEQRFRREAFAAAGLANPHVVPIHSFGEIDGRLYVDMRLVEGRDLHQIITEAPLPLPRAVSIIAQVASALQAAHKIGLIHRDVKPSNILVDEDDFAYLIDFGIARTAGQTNMTATGGVIGTWAYMAPERFSGDQTDGRADVYALACVLHECLTGSQPFPTTSLERQIVAHITEPPPRPSTLQPTVPSSMDVVIAKGMAKNPDERFQTVKDLANAAHAAATTYPASVPAEVPVGPVEQPRPAPSTAPPIEHTTQPIQLPAMPPTGAIQYRPPAGPNYLAPPTGPNYLAATPPVDVTKPDKARRIALAAMGALIVTVAVVAGMALIPDRGSQTGDQQGPAPTRSALPNTGPFTGTFTVAIGPHTLSNGKPVTADPADAAAFSETWHLRSACASNGCVATASTGGRYPSKDLVFDNVDGGWLAVTTSRQRCGKRDDVEAWNVILLRPQPNGTMSGEWIDNAPNGCSRKRTLTFTRVAEADVSLLPDPAILPPRSVSPAEALHGGYDFVLTNVGRGSAKALHVIARTDCLRAGNRCLSALLSPETGGIQGMVFEDRTWAKTQEYDTVCPKGGDLHAKLTSTLPLPEPLQDPIRLLSGHGYSEYTPSTKCPSGATDETYTRTGD